MSKRSSSVHIGRPTLNGKKAIFWRKRGTRCIRRRTCALKSSNRSAPSGFVEGSTIETPPTCARSGAPCTRTARPARSACRAFLPPVVLRVSIPLIASAGNFAAAVKQSRAPRALAVSSVSSCGARANSGGTIPHRPSHGRAPRRGPVRLRTDRVQAPTGQHRAVRRLCAPASVARGLLVPRGCLFAHSALARLTFLSEMVWMAGPA